MCNPLKQWKTAALQHSAIPQHSVRAQQAPKSTAAASLLAVQMAYFARPTARHCFMH
jgi:hypothetical protein